MTVELQGFAVVMVYAVAVLALLGACALALSAMEDVLIKNDDEEK